ncbi:hypothetical protein C8R44DRAFT_862758 [Mycena epipterygia]|nr:hypothetical protein C8R44DRAFT_862758 [Mycena epipterygia]
MAPEVSSDLKERIVQWYLEDRMRAYTMEDIAILAGVSIGLVSKTINLYLKDGQVSNPFGRRPGHPKTLNNGIYTLSRRFCVRRSSGGPDILEDDVSSTESLYL